MAQITLSHWGDRIHLWHQAKSYAGFMVCPIKISESRFQYSVFTPDGASCCFPEDQEREYETVDQAILAGVRYCESTSNAITYIQVAQHLFQMKIIDGSTFGRVEQEAWSW